MNVLITGAGLIGSHIARKLVEAGEEPILYEVAPSYEYIGGVGDLNKVKVVKGDISNLPKLIATAREEKVDCIVHTAALQGAVQEKPYWGVKINIEGTVNVLETARLMDIKRVVFCSTQGVYNLAVRTKRPMTEDHPLRPKNLYSATKMIGEYLGLNYANFYGIDFVALRLAVVFGPEYWGGGSVHGRVLSELLEKSLRGGAAAIQLPPGFAPRNEYVYVKDVANAVLLACRVRKLGNRIYNIGSGELYDLSEIVEIVKKLLPGADIKLIEPRSRLATLIRSQSYDLSRARMDLGYEPHYDLEQGLRDYMNSVQGKLIQE